MRRRLYPYEAEVIRRSRQISVQPRPGRRRRYDRECPTAPPGPTPTAGYKAGALGIPASAAPGADLATPAAARNRSSAGQDGVDADWPSEKSGGCVVSAPARPTVRYTISQMIACSIRYKSSHK